MKKRSKLKYDNDDGNDITCDDGDDDNDDDDDDDDGPCSEKESWSDTADGSWFLYRDGK